MRLIISAIFCLVFVLSNTSKAQEFPSSASQNSNFNSFNINLGYGVYSYQSLIARVLNQSLNFETKQQGPIHFRFGYRFSRVVELGTSVNFENQEFTWLNSQKEQAYARIKSLSGLFRANFHFLKSQEFDFYLGAALGLRFDSYDIRIPQGGVGFEIPFGTSQLLPGGELVLGFRGYITEYIGVYTELGLTKSPIQLGLCIKLNKPNS